MIVSILIWLYECCFFFFVSSSSSTGSCSAGTGVLILVAAIIPPKLNFLDRLLNLSIRVVRAGIGTEAVFYAIFPY
jgi:hypothetical protein